MTMFFSCKKTSTDTTPTSPIVYDTLFLNAAKNYCLNSGSSSFLVYQNGQYLTENYYGSTTASTKLLLASGTKSFNGITAMLAVQDGIINIDNFAKESLTEWNSDPLKSLITYKILLNQTSGLTPGVAGTATNLASWDSIIASPMVYNPGERFNYGPYHFNAFGYAVERKLAGGETHEAYMKRKLFDPLGMSVDWNFKSGGTKPQLGGGAFSTAKDWSKLGILILQKGKWNGVQILSETLLNRCFVSTDPQNPAYGLSWWLNKPVSSTLISQIPTLQELAPMLNNSLLPRDIIFAAGSGKQRLYIIPSKNAVIVRNGPVSSSNTFEDSDFLMYLLFGHL